MTSFHFDFLQNNISEQVKKWNGTEDDIKVLTSYREYDIRKWKLVQRMLQKGNLTRDFFEALRNRPYLAPTRKQLISQKYEQVLILYEQVFYNSSFTSYPEEIHSDYILLLEETKKLSYEFESAYCELLALDPKTSIAQDFRKLDNRKKIW